MTRFKQYINEEIEDDGKDILLNLKEECSPFLKEYNKGFLWRGTKRNVDTIRYFTPRTERKPLDTSEKLHDILNDEFNKKFGWKVRNGVFVTPNERDAWYYGDDSAYMFFPVGKYKYCYSKYKDLAADMDRDVYAWFHYSDTILFALWKKRKIKEDFKVWSERERKRRDKGYEQMARDVIRLYTNKNLSKVVNKRNEVSFNCKGYYLVNPNYADYIAKRI
jgi:hypothetical protein